jgi:chromosome segregation ATPase
MNNKLFEQYGATASLPNDSTSPVGGRGMVVNNEPTLANLRSQVQRQSSQIELLTRELNRAQTAIRNLESQLTQTISSIRSANRD